MIECWKRPRLNTFRNGNARNRFPDRRRRYFAPCFRKCSENTKRTTFARYNLTPLMDSDVLEIVHRDSQAARHSYNSFFHRATERIGIAVVIDRARSALTDKLF